MRIDFDATFVVGFSSFLDAIESSFSRASGAGFFPAYFGRDYLTFQDCLYGGCCGHHPYHFYGYNAETMIEAFGYSGQIASCDEGLRRLATLQADDWFIEEQRVYLLSTIERAIKGEGPTLLDELVDTIREAPASLTLFGADGATLVRVVGKVDPSEVETV